MSVIDRSSLFRSEENEAERVHSDGIQSDHIHSVGNPVMEGDQEPPAIRLGFKPIPQKGWINERLGKRLSIIYLAVVSIFALTVSISLIVAIVSTAKSEEPPAITTENVGGTSTIMTPNRTQTASVSVTYSQSISSSKSTLRFSTTTTTKQKTSSRRSTRRSSTTTTNKPHISIHCMFVGDVLNLGKDWTAVEQYYEEKEMIFQIAESVINLHDNNTVASWAYGYVRPTSFRQRFESFTNNWQKFAEYTHELMKFYNNSISPPGGNDDVFLEINETGDDDQMANCLVFLSAMTDVAGYTIKPNCVHYKKIVVVNMAGGDFSKILDDNRGTVVPVTQSYMERENSERVFKAILEGF